jgi:AAA ATPase domain
MDEVSIRRVGRCPRHLDAGIRIDPEGTPEYERPSVFDGLNTTATSPGRTLRAGSADTVAGDEDPWGRRAGKGRHEVADTSVGRSGRGHEDVVAVAERLNERHRRAGPVCEAASINLTLGRAPRPLVGRHDELAELERFVAAICERSAVLFVEGEPGIGKTTLWGEGLRLAGERGYSVLACRAVESEAKLGFAGLGDLLEPVLDDALPHLPAPQRQALEIALLRVERAQGTASPRAVALACLNLLRGLALRAPVLVAVDDLPWLDAASRRVLDFALRRLEQERVGFLLAARRSLAAETSVSFPRTRMSGD